jgi:hypothetical protein
MKKLISSIIGAFFLIVLLVTVYFVNSISNDFKNSDAFASVIELIEKNQTIIPVINKQFEVSYFIGGDLNSEVAHFNFKVYSQKRKFVVYVDLERNQSDLWEIVDFEAKEK